MGPQFMYLHALVVVYVHAILLSHGEQGMILQESNIMYFFIHVKFCDQLLFGVLH